jgi:hypothetical protein
VALAQNLKILCQYGIEDQAGPCTSRTKFSPNHRPAEVVEAASATGQALLMRDGFGQRPKSGNLSRLWLPGIGVFWCDSKTTS